VAFAAPKQQITANDLPGLKGTWQGILDLGLMGTAASTPVTLEILNDTVPVKARLTLRNVPDDAARAMGVMSGSNVFESDEGLITSQGTLCWTGAQKGYFEIAVDGSELDGTYWFRGVKGSVDLKKMYASTAYVPPKPKITAKETPGLKGTWEGMLDWGLMGTAASSPVTLEIFTDTVPIKAKLTIRNVPDDAARAMGVQTGSMVAESDDGVITTQGTIFWTGPQKNFFEVSAVGNHLKGDYYFRGVKGSASLKKK